VDESSNYSLWIVPVTRVFTLPPLPPPKKVKVVKKIIKKRTPNEDPFDENGEKKKIIKVVRKKIEKKDTSPSPETNGIHTNGSDKMLMKLQRQLPADPSLHFPTSILTSVQVHILNPVDIMRAIKVKWEPVAMLAKRASLHYRTQLERTMEDRLGEGLRLKAAQRILRLDSFLVESTVTKLEKDTTK
ncbi:hypothetical protein TELCIR_19304, partial [Teladorsagia circumcincta]